MADRVAQLAELKLILGPLLKKPMRRVPEADPDYEDEDARCVFCGAVYDNAFGERDGVQSWRVVVETTPHAPDCPTRRIDALLAFAPDEARLAGELETLRAQRAYLERELANLKAHCDALTELASRTFS